MFQSSYTFENNGRRTHKKTLNMMTSSSSSPFLPVNFHAYYGEFSSFKIRITSQLGIIFPHVRTFFFYFSNLWCSHDLFTRFTFRISAAICRISLVSMFMTTPLWNLCSVIADVIQFSNFGRCFVLCSSEQPDRFLLARVKSPLSWFSRLVELILNLLHENYGSQ